METVRHLPPRGVGPLLYSRLAAPAEFVERLQTDRGTLEAEIRERLLSGPDHPFVYLQGLPLVSRLLPEIVLGIQAGRHVDWRWTERHLGWRAR